MELACLILTVCSDRVFAFCLQQLVIMLVFLLLTTAVLSLKVSGLIAAAIWAPQGAHTEVYSLHL